MTTSIKSPKSKTHSTDFVASFIQKSYQLLEDKKFIHVVDWNAEGTAIVIKKPQEFSKNVLPAYFKHNNLTSFVRQLNMYDFRKRRTKAYDHVYYHDLFQRGQSHLLKDIKRKNQEPSIANIQKAIEALKSIEHGHHTEQTDQMVDTYESQLLRKINKDALVKIETLESKVKELMTQNQSLQSQVSMQLKKEDILVSFMSEIMKKNGVRLDQLPEALSGQFKLSNISLGEDMKAIKEENTDIKEAKAFIQERKNIPSSSRDITNLNEITSDSTDMPCSSPHSKRRFSCHKLQTDDVEDQVDEWGFSSRNCIRASQIMRRRFDNDEDEFENFGKMIKLEASSELGGMTGGFGTHRNMNIAGGETGCIKQEPIDSFMIASQNVDEFLNDSVDLMNFS